MYPLVIGITSNPYSMSSILQLPKTSCCGCSACSLSCPMQLIRMTPDAEGFLYPEIQYPERCIHCDKCEKVCPIINVDTIQIPTHNQQVYAGFVRETTYLQKSASGGIASAISQKIINEGGVVYGVAYIDDFTKAEYRKAETLAELEAFRSSKYIQAEKGTIFSDVKDTLEAGKDVLFIGLPCEVAGLKSYLRKKYENLTTAELICHGPTSPKVAEEFIHTLERKYQSRVIGFNVRYKKDGKWTPPYLRAEFENGKVFLESFYATDYGRAFGIFSRPSCYECTYKGDKRVADITLGDYWGCTPEDIFYNQSGVSVIFVHTEKGAALIEGVRDLELTETELEHASKANPMLQTSKTKNPRRDVFTEALVENGLSAACRKSQMAKQRVVGFAVKWCPKWVKKVVREVLWGR